MIERYKSIINLLVIILPFLIFVGCSEIKRTVNSEDVRISVDYIEEEEKPRLMKYLSALEAKDVEVFEGYTMEDSTYLATLYLLVKGGEKIPNKTKAQKSAIGYKLATVLEGSLDNENYYDQIRVQFVNDQSIDTFQTDYQLYD